MDGSADGWTREICHTGLRYAVRRPDLDIPGGVGLVEWRWDIRIRRALRCMGWAGLRSCVLGVGLTFVPWEVQWQSRQAHRACSTPSCVFHDATHAGCALALASLRPHDATVPPPHRAPRSR